jgi:hypothetical protein
LTLNPDFTLLSSGKTFSSGLKSAIAFHENAGGCQVDFDFVFFFVLLTFLPSPATSAEVIARKEREPVVCRLPLTAAAKTGRAMELSSPIPSLVPSLVLNAMVTFGDSGTMVLVRDDPV